MCTASDREFGMVIYGASGFTGKHVVEYVVNMPEEEKNFKWAVAGRNTKKLQEILQEISALTGKDLSNIQIIKAAVDDDLSLTAMCSRTKIVLNCVGPYIKYGEPVVKACIQSGSHHIDISAESLFVGEMQLKYHEASQKAKVYIIGNAGFDSVPCETGIQYLQEQFNGDVCSIETMSNLNAGLGKTLANFGTLQSAILHLSKERELNDVHSKIFSNPIPKSKYPLKSRGVIHFFEEINAWCVRFLNTDVDVVNRTQYYNYHNKHMKPVQMMSYLVIPGSYVFAVTVATGLILFLLLCKCRPGKFLLKKFPAVTTLGIFTKTGPTREHIKEACFDMYIIGHGYHETSTEPGDQDNHPPNKKMIVKVHGPEPGYSLTPMIMVQTALVILHEKEKLPDDGGVFTPGVAFRHTTLRERLIKNGMTYEVVSQ